MKRVMVMAGEMSGDQHGARLIRQIRAVNPDVEFFGIGGEAMRAEGVEILVDAQHMAVLGLVEVLMKYRFFRRILHQMTQLLQTRKPDAILLIDYPGFNLRMAAAAKKMGIKVIYYISPQVWAWHQSRIPKMAKIIDLLMVIFPFEKEVFRNTAMRVEFVGHPLVEPIRKFLDTPPMELLWPEQKHVAVLPGSRRQEIKRILPLMLAASEEIIKRVPDAGFLIAAASENIAVRIESQLRQLPEEKQKYYRVVTGQMREVVRQSVAAMVCSGTATVETALLRCPMIVVYRAAALTYAIGRRLVKVKWLGMVNLVANRTLCPEFIQHDAKPVSMANALIPLMAETPQRFRQLEGLSEVANALSGDGEAKDTGQVFWSAFDI